MTTEQKQEYLDLAKSLAYKAGEIMRKNFLQTSVEWKEDATPLTIADTTINRLVIERINMEYPTHSILGEEESDFKENSSYTWVCDPVDGTMPYSHGLSISTFSLALCVDGRPMVGVVYDPFMDRLFWASSGEGAYCNDNKLSANSYNMTNALINIDGFPSVRPVINIGGEIIDRLFEKGAKVTSLWSAILPSCLVATGDYSAVVLNVPFPQDPAAIKVIVEEAGGKVTDLFGNDQRYDRPTKGFIASNGQIHDELVQTIQELS